MWIVPTLHTLAMRHSHKRRHDKLEAATKNTPFVADGGHFCNPCAQYNNGL